MHKQTLFYVLQSTDEATRMTDKKGGVTEMSNKIQRVEEKKKRTKKVCPKTTNGRNIPAIKYEKYKLVSKLTLEHN